MKSFFFAAVLTIAVAIAHAQTAAQINNTDISTRESWCNSQVSVCDNICQGKSTQNSCSPKSLAWVCSCTNSTAKIDEQVDLTIPYFTCLEYNWSPCFKACPPADQSCVDACNNKYVCGKVKANNTRTNTSDTSKTNTNDNGAKPPSVSTDAASNVSTTFSIFFGCLVVLFVSYL